MFLTQQQVIIQQVNEILRNKRFTRTLKQTAAKNKLKNSQVPKTTKHHEKYKFKIMSHFSNNNSRNNNNNKSSSTFKSFNSSHPVHRNKMSLVVEIRRYVEAGNNPEPYDGTVGCLWVPCRKAIVVNIHEKGADIVFDKDNYG